jgi:peroxiredoxin
VIWAGVSGAAVLAGVVIGVLSATQSSPAPTSPVPASAADRNAPASLVKAANAVGFHPTTEAGVGEMEGRPASAALPPEAPTLLAEGTKAPLFALKTPQGQPVNLSDYRGKTVLLEFFTTWCPHCNAEAPHLRKLYASLPKTKVAFVSVNADGETAPSVYAFHRYHGLQFPALIDPGSLRGSFNRQGVEGPVTTAYHVGAYPTFYVLNAHGTITWRSDGEQPDAVLRQELQKAGSGA